MNDLKIEFNNDSAKPIKNLPEDHYCSSYQLCFKNKGDSESFLCCDFCKTKCDMKCICDHTKCNYFMTKDWISEKINANHIMDKPTQKLSKKEVKVNNLETKQTPEIAVEEPVRQEVKEEKEPEMEGDYVKLW